MQKYRLVSTVMCTLATVLIHFKSRCMVDLEAFLEENNVLVPGGKKQLMEIYKRATAESFCLLTMNMLTKDPSNVCMKKLEAYLVPSWLTFVHSIACFLNQCYSKKSFRKPVSLSARAHLLRYCLSKASSLPKDVCLMHLRCIDFVDLAPRDVAANLAQNKYNQKYYS